MAMNPIPEHPQFARVVGEDNWSKLPNIPDIVSVANHQIASAGIAYGNADIITVSNEQVKENLTGKTGEGADLANTANADKQTSQGDAFTKRGEITAMLGQLTLTNKTAMEALLTEYDTRVAEIKAKADAEDWTQSELVAAEQSLVDELKSKADGLGAGQETDSAALAAGLTNPEVSPSDLTGHLGPTSGASSMPQGLDQALQSALGSLQGSQGQASGLGNKALETLPQLLQNIKDGGGDSAYIDDAALQDLVANQEGSGDSDSGGAADAGPASGTEDKPGEGPAPEDTQELGDIAAEDRPQNALGTEPPSGPPPPPNAVNAGLTTGTEAPSEAVSGAAQPASAAQPTTHLSGEGAAEPASGSTTAGNPAVGNTGAGGPVGGGSGLNGLLSGQQTDSGGGSTPPPSAPSAVSDTSAAAGTQLSSAGGAATLPSAGAGLSTPMTAAPSGFGSGLGGPLGGAGVPAAAPAAMGGFAPVGNLTTPMTHMAPAAPAAAPAAAPNMTQTAGPLAPGQTTSPGQQTAAQPHAGASLTPAPGPAPAGAPAAPYGAASQLAGVAPVPMATPAMDRVPTGGFHNSPESLTGTERRAASVLSSVRLGMARAGVVSALAAGVYEDGSHIVASCDGLGYLPDGVNLPAKVTPLMEYVPDLFLSDMTGHTSPSYVLHLAASLGMIPEPLVIVSTDTNRDDDRVTLVSSEVLRAVPHAEVATHRTAFGGIDPADAEAVFTLLQGEWGPSYASLDDAARELSAHRWSSHRDGAATAALVRFMLTDAATSHAAGRVSDACYALQRALWVRPASGA